MSGDSSLTKTEKFMYGICDLAINTLIAAISFYFIYFLLNNAGISTAYCSFITLFAKIFEAFLDTFIGRISDRTISRFGKKRVFVLFTTPFFGLFFALMWIELSSTTSTGLKVLYYLVIYTIFMSCYGIICVPYNSMVANLTNSYDERTSIIGCRIGCANTGIILGAGIWALLCVGQESLFYPVFKSVSKAHLVTGVIFGIFSVIVLLVGSFYVKEKFDNTETSEKSLFRSIVEIVKVKQFLCVCANFAFTNTSVDIIMSIFLFYISDVLDFGGGAVAMGLVALPLVTAIASAVGWVALSAKWSKSLAYLTASLLMVIALISAIFIPKKNYAVIPVVFVAGLGLSGIQIIPFSYISDIVEYDEYVNGTRREGIVNGLVLFLYKVSSAIFVSVTTAIYGAAGYIEHSSDVQVSQPESALFSIRLLLGLMPTFFLILAAVLAFFIKIDKTKFETMLNELNEKKNKDVHQISSPGTNNPASFDDI